MNIRSVCYAQPGNSFTLTPAVSARPGENTGGLNFLSLIAYIAKTQLNCRDENNGIDVRRTK